MSLPAGEPPFRNPVLRWIEHRLPILSLLDRSLVRYPTPRNLNWWWVFGSLAGFMLVAMIVSGVFLAMNYQPDPDYAFVSIQRIMRDVNEGWLIQAIHVDGASMFFIVVYLHMGRGLYYGSYKRPRELLWMIGVLLFLAMMATAFSGDVLPWDQRSYTAATVVANLFGTLPLIGHSVANWLRGGFAVGAPTLNRLFIMHIILPFGLVAMALLHLSALHRHGSNNPLGVDGHPAARPVPFHPRYTIKDMLGLGALLIVFAGVVFFAPGLFRTPDDAIPADPMSTPGDIEPDWYFLPFYAILRALPGPGVGALALFGSVAILFFLPWLDTSPVRSGRFRPLFRWFHAALVLDVAVLGWVGAQPTGDGFTLLARAATFWYFAHFLIVLPLLGRFERPRAVPE